MKGWPQVITGVELNCSATTQGANLVMHVDPTSSLTNAAP